MLNSMWDGLVDFPQLLKLLLYMASNISLLPQSFLLQIRVLVLISLF